MDSAAPPRHHRGVTVIPSPRGSSVVGGRDRSGRALRITAHPEADRVVVSTWQERTCVATVRLACVDVPDLLGALGAAAIACAARPAGTPDPARAARPGGASRPGDDLSGAASGVSAA